MALTQSEKSMIVRRERHLVAQMNNVISAQGRLVKRTPSAARSCCLSLLQRTLDELRRKRDALWRRRTA